MIFFNHLDIVFIFVGLARNVEKRSLEMQPGVGGVKNQKCSMNLLTSCLFPITWAHILIKPLLWDLQSATSVWESCLMQVSIILADACKCENFSVAGEWILCCLWHYDPKLYHFPTVSFYLPISRSHFLEWESQGPFFLNFTSSLSIISIIVTASRERTCWYFEDCKHKSRMCNKNHIS